MIVMVVTTVMIIMVVTTIVALGEALMTIPAIAARARALLGDDAATCEAECEQGNQDPHEIRVTRGTTAALARTPRHEGRAGSSCQKVRRKPTCADVGA